MCVLPMNRQQILDSFSPTSLSAVDPGESHPNYFLDQQERLITDTKRELAWLSEMIHVAQGAKGNITRVTVSSKIKSQIEIAIRMNEDCIDAEERLQERQRRRIEIISKQSNANADPEISDLDRMTKELQQARELAGRLNYLRSQSAVPHAYMRTLIEEITERQVWLAHDQLMLQRGAQELSKGRAVDGGKSV